MTKQQIAKTIKKQRETKKLTPYALAKLAGVRQYVINNIEDGNVNYKVDDLIKVVGALEIKINLEI